MTDSVVKQNMSAKAAVIGWPVSHSLSPVIHNHWFETLGIDGHYEKHAVEPGRLAEFIAYAQAEPLVGWNVTIPYKSEIIPYLDKLAPLARQMGAVNTVKREKDGSLTGYNTDSIGLITHLKQTAPDFPRDKPALVIGAGGAARAAVLGLLGENLPFVMLSNRTREKADLIASKLGRNRVMVVDFDDIDQSVQAAGLVVNTTSLGMGDNPPLRMDLSRAGPDTVVYDIVYTPLETPLLKMAAGHSLRTVDGLGMLVWQAAASFKIWFGLDVTYDPALKAQLKRCLA